MATVNANAVKPHPLVDGELWFVKKKKVYSF